MPLNTQSIDAKTLKKIKEGPRFTRQVQGASGPMTLTFAKLDQREEPSAEAIQRWYQRYAYPKEGFCHIPVDNFTRDEKGNIARYCWCYLVG